jgi:hypothetical protein
MITAAVHLDRRPGNSALGGKIESGNYWAGVVDNAPCRSNLELSIREPCTIPVRQGFRRRNASAAATLWRDTMAGQGGWTRLMNSDRYREGVGAITGNRFSKMTGIAGEYRVPKDSPAGWR